jgi:hypothetical protein
MVLMEGIAYSALMVESRHEILLAFLCADGEEEFGHFEAQIVLRMR